jgi:hypothetical protein
MRLEDIDHIFEGGGITGGVIGKNGLLNDRRKDIEREQHHLPSEGVRVRLSLARWAGRMIPLTMSKRRQVDLRSRSTSEQAGICRCFWWDNWGRGVRRASAC